MEEKITEKNDVKVVSSSPQAKSTTPPDGGIRAWGVMIGSFFCNGIIFGTINSGGIIFDALHDILEAEGVANPASQASITLSLAIGTTFFLSMVSGVLTDKFGIRPITVVGGIIASIGMILSAFCFTQPILLTLTMGLTFGIGASLAYTPSLVILGHYFSKKIGIVNGFVTAGSSVFTIIITALLQYVVEHHGLKLVFLILGIMMTVLIVAGIVFKPILAKPNTAQKNKKEGKCGNICGQFINYDIWRIRKYVIWALAIPSALFGYFVPYVHLKKYANDVLDSNSTITNCTATLHGIFDANSTQAVENISFGASPSVESCAQVFGDVLLQNNCSTILLNMLNATVLYVSNDNNHCIKLLHDSPFGESSSEIIIQVLGGASGIGRLIFGLVADRPWVDRILLQQISFFCIGSLTMLLTLADAMWMFIIIAFGMGLFDGCFISLLGPIAFDIVGSSGASQAIGNLLALCAIPLTIGPFVAGVLYDKLGSYVIPFLCAGVPPIIGCFALCLIRFVKDTPKANSKVDGVSSKNNIEPESVALMNDKKEESLAVDPRRIVLIDKESSV